MNSNNIKRLSIGDEWDCKRNWQENSICINLKGYIELEVENSIEFNELYKYVLELVIYMQLFKPNKFQINKMMICVKEKYYYFYMPIKEMNYTKRYIQNSVDDSLLIFLEKSYKKISYRETKDILGNISYIIFNNSRNIEDNFLMLYRFVECYYKKKGKYGFIEDSIKNNYKKNNH